MVAISICRLLVLEIEVAQFADIETCHSKSQQLHWNEASYCRRDAKMRWRVGRPSVTDGGLLNLDDCCRYDNTSTDVGIWHAGWDRQRCCISLDLTGSAGSTVYASGYNESPVAVEVKARKSSDAPRCTVWLFAGANPPAEALPASAVLRLVHLDLDGTDQNPRGLSSSWKTIVTVPAYTAFSVLIGYLSEVEGGSDACSQESSGAHLHMDAPVSAAKNSALRNRQSVTSTTWVYIF